MIVAFTGLEVSLLMSAALVEISWAFNLNNWSLLLGVLGTTGSLSRWRRG